MAILRECPTCHRKQKLKNKVCDCGEDMDKAKKTLADAGYAWDSEGERTLDAMSGLWCANVGYGQQALVDAATRQMRELPFYNAFFQTATPPAIELTRRACTTPGRGRT